MTQLLTVREAMEILDVSAMTVRRWCKTGVLVDALKVGTYWVIPKSSVDSLKRPKRGRPSKNA
jgi:excisionase family DNA binding protein